MSNVEKVRALYRGIAERDPALAAAQVDPARYAEHDPNLDGGVEGLRRYVAERQPGDRLALVRVLEEASSSSRRRTGAFAATAPSSTYSGSRTA